MLIGKLMRAKMVLMPYFKEKYSPKLSYKLMKLISQIETEEKFFNERVTEIIHTYADKDESGELIYLDGGIKIKEDMQNECNRVFEELNAVEVDAPSIRFSLEELSEIKLSVEDMVILEDFIIEE